MGKKLQSIELTKLPTTPNEYTYRNSGINVKAVEQRQLQALEGWRTFDEDEKRFLAVLAWAGNKSKASAVIGKSKSWATRRIQSNHLFEEAVEQRLWHPVWIAQQMGQDLLGKSLLALEDVLDNGTDSAKVTAAQTILKLNKMMPEQQEYANEDDEDIGIQLTGWLGGRLDYIEDVYDQYDNEFEEKRDQGYIIKGSFWLSPKQQIRADVSAISQTNGEWIDNDGLGALPERHPFIEEHYEFPDWVGRPQ